MPQKSFMPVRIPSVTWWVCLSMGFLTCCESQQAETSDARSDGTGAATSAGGNAVNQSGTPTQDSTVTSRGGASSPNGVGGSTAQGGGAQGSAITSESPANGGAATSGFGSTTTRPEQPLEGGATNGGSPATTNKATTSKATGGKSAGGASNGSKASGGAGGASKSTNAGVGGSAAGGTSGGRTTSSAKASGGAASSSGGTSTRPAETGGKPTGGAAAGGTTASSGASSDNLCPSGITKTITVAKDGSGQYSTVQAAIDSVANGSTAHIRVNIKAGTYTEKLTIANRTNLCLVGDDADTTILTYNDSNGSVGSTSGSASVWISANDFSATRLTFRNSYGAGSQAVALRTTGQRQQFSDCRLVGYQDTLYVHSGTQYFRKCYVQGNTDYVFGGATAVLQDCEVRNVQSGSAVAAPNTASSTAYGIVFLGGQFTAASGVSNVALARPWGADGAAAFLNASLGGHISAAGFTSMSGNSPANARFVEYQSTGAGANASGRNSYQMTASEAATYTIAKIFGGTWTPSYSQ